MPSRLIDQLRMMLHTGASNDHTNPLAYNYIYVNEDKISRSLICPICLDPLIDPQTHILCENSFCNRCIKKLKHCPYCRTSIMESNDLKIASHSLRNILDEIQVQCNICKQILCRGDFDIHIQNNCLQQPSLTSDVEEGNNNEHHIEKHLSNLYRRVHKLENELYELKKVIYIFLLVLSTVGTILSIGALFSYITHSFLLILFTTWLPTLLPTISKFLFDFSPITIIMQAIRQSLTFAVQRRITYIRSSLIVQQVRTAGGDSHSSENQKKSGRQSDLNKTKTSDKKQKLKTTDDTKQPGVTRKDWNKPNQVVSDDPPYGKAGGSIDAHNPDRGKKP